MPPSHAKRANKPHKKTPFLKPHAQYPCFSVPSIFSDFFSSSKLYFLFYHDLDFLLSNSLVISEEKTNTQFSPMEERRFLYELRFILSIYLHKFMDSLCTQTISFLSALSSDPLFSCIVAFSTLVYLYLPHLFLKIVLSPVLLLTAILLLILLRLGAIQNSQHEPKENQDKVEPIFNVENRACKEEKQSSSPIEPEEPNSHEKVNQWVNSCSNTETELESQMGVKDSSFFVEWDVTAPLEVIYEEYEGEEEEETGDDPSYEREENQNMGMLRYPSLSRYYPESESDSSSENGFPATEDWESPENICYRWDEEDREGLIEIALDGCKRKSEFQFQEENMIEIDISPTRHRELSGEDKVFSGEISCS
ncbi:uncharacterized protein LOC130710835 [Lotus japonicus]|uniref:uncharacterized protein LOC130710835 n=1 Tax=Lotus japonicus TaxID=34305 RepID=UPI0025873650|nr:uncharacterized protein LOC130710835 [Lotus japonicus]